MKNRLFLLILCIAVGMFFYGCGLTSAPQIRMERDIETLRDNDDTIEDDYNAKIEQVREAIRKVENTYKTSVEAALRNQASIAADIDTIRSEFRQVKGDVESISNRTGLELKQGKKKIDDYDLRLRELEIEVAQLKGKLETLENNQKIFTTMFSKGLQPSPVFTTQPMKSVIEEGGDTSETTEGGETPNKVVEGETEAGTGGATKNAAETTITQEKGVTDAKEGGKPVDEGAKAAKSAISPEVQAEYDKALSVFRNEKFDEAKKMFIEFINKYPDTEITDNAQFYVAECLYKKKEFEKAILEYDKMITNYPDSNKVASALLKEGFSLLQLNYKDEAVNILKKLIKGYPDTNQAEIARRKIKVIK